MVLVLGMLAATGPMAIDMYLPSIPAMAVALNANEGAVQLTLMTFFAGLMLGQLAYGPLSDKFGRKPLAFVGLGVFIFGSAACALATDITQLQWLRFLQGVGGSIGMVIAFAMIAALLPETRQAADRQAFELSRTFHNYARIFVDKRFIPLTLALCSAQAGFFAYIAGSASVFISEHHLTSTQFSLIFGVNAVGLMAAALINPVLHIRVPWPTWAAWA